MQKHQSASYLLFNKFHSSLDDGFDDNIVYIYYGWINDKFSNNNFKAGNFSTNSDLITRHSMNIKNCYILLTQKKICLYLDNLLGFTLEIYLLDVIDILQDINNQNYLEILYNNKEDNKSKKFEIVLENKYYFLEKFIANYTYNKLNIFHGVSHFGMSLQKFDFLEKNKNGENDPTINELLERKVYNKFDLYKDYCESLEKTKHEHKHDHEDVDADKDKDPAPSSITMKKGIRRSSKQTQPGEIRLKNILKINDQLKNTGSSCFYYKRGIYRYKKNYIIIPANTFKQMDDVFIIDNPENKKTPIKLIMGSSSSSPVELLDTNSDIAEIDENAHSTFLNCIRIFGFENFMITKSEKFNTINNKFSLEDRGKKEVWLIEAKTSLKGKSFLNISMIFIRKSFIPPFFDSFKDFYFMVLEKKKLPNNLNTEYMKGILLNKNLGKKLHIISENSNSNASNISSFEDNSKIYKLENSRIKLGEKSNSQSDQENSVEKFGTKLDESGVIRKTKIIKKKKILYVKKSELKKLKEKSQNESNESSNDSIKLKTEKFKPISKKFVKRKVINEYQILKNCNFNLSSFGNEIIRDIGESFSTILLYNDEFYKKMLPLIMIKMETFSCMKSFYENSVEEILGYEKLKDLLIFGLGILYKILLILKEVSLEDVKELIVHCEKYIRKCSSQPDYLDIIKEKMEMKSLDDLLQENEKRLGSFFTGYNLNEKDENSDVKEIMTKSRKSIIENRNDFIVFVLSGKFIKEIDINIEKIILLSYRNIESKNIIEKFFFKLLNLKASHEKNDKSERVIINDICTFKEDNLSLKVTYDEEVMAAFIKTNFFMMNEIIDNVESLENFYFYILENNSSNKLLNGFHTFLKKMSDSDINYDKIIKANFDTKTEIHVHKFKQNEQKQNEFDKSKFTKKSYVQSDNFLIDDQNDTYDEQTPTTKDPLKFQKRFNYKYFSNSIQYKFSTAHLNLLKENENLNKNLIKFRKEKLINLFYKFFSNKDVNLTKTLISCKCLIILCKENYEVRKFLIKKNIFKNIQDHMASFTDETIVVHGLKLFEIFLDPNDIYVVEYMKEFDLWDDYIIILINIIINWSFQGIKCSSSIMCGILNLLYKISSFSIVDMSTLFTIGYISQEIKLNEEDYLYKKQENEKNKILPIEKKKINDFFRYILDDYYLDNFIIDQENKLVIYEKLLMLILRSYKIDSKVKNIPWIKELNSIIEEKFIGIYHHLEHTVMEYLNIDFIDCDRIHEDHKKMTDLNNTYKLYFTTIFYFKEIQDERSLVKMLRHDNSPFGVLVRLIKACKSHNEIFPLWEKTEYFYSLIETDDGDYEMFMNLEELMDSKKERN